MIEQVNANVDLKEQLFIDFRQNYNTKVRKGHHNKRNDDKDFQFMIDQLDHLKANVKLPGRTFGNFEHEENFFNTINKANFIRWCNTKLKVAATQMETKMTSPVSGNCELSSERSDSE